MAARSIRSGFEIPIRNTDVLLEKISDEEIIQLIINPIKSELRRKRATHQIEIFFTKIRSHPKMRSYFIKKIIELIQYETKGGKNK